MKISFCRTPFHADVFTSYSWSVNICGEKKWILLPPGEEHKLKNKFGELPYDICDKDCDNFQVKYLLVTQKPGDALFVPSGWHHQVWNMVNIYLLHFLLSTRNSLLYSLFICNTKIFASRWTQFQSTTIGSTVVISIKCGSL